MRSLSVLACDDEPLALARIAELITARVNTTLLAAIQDPQIALTEIIRLQPDVVLLDVAMPKLTGFDVLDALRLSSEDTYCPQVILVTAHLEFAVDAFAAEVLDFLTKPVRYARLDRALTRASENIEAQDARQRLAKLDQELTALRERSMKPTQPGALWVRVRGESVRIPYSSIESLTAEGEYTRLNCVGTSHLHREAMGGLVNRLSQEGFIRIHRSTAVRLASIVGLSRSLNGGARVRLDNDREYPVGRRYRQELELRLSRTRPLVAIHGSLDKS